jgi:hypothetical protein
MCLEGVSVVFWGCVWCVLGITVVIWGRRSGGGGVLNIRRLEFSLRPACDGGFCGVGCGAK